MKEEGVREGFVDEEAYFEKVAEEKYSANMDGEGADGSSPADEKVLKNKADDGTDCDAFIFC